MRTTFFFITERTGTTDFLYHGDRVGRVNGELAEIGSDIASTHELEPVLERLVARTQELMKVDVIALYMMQPDGRSMRAPRHPDAHPGLRTVRPGHDVRCWLYHDAEGRVIREGAPSSFGRTVHLDVASPEVAG